MSFPDGYLFIQELRENPSKVFWIIGGVIVICVMAKWLDSIEDKRRKRRSKDHDSENFR